MTKKQLITQYIEENQLHNEPKRTIARMVVRAFPEVFEQTDKQINSVRRQVTNILPCNKFCVFSAVVNVGSTIYSAFIAGVTLLPKK